MKRTLDVSTVLKDFTGEPLKEDGKDVTLKYALLVYARNGHQMKLSRPEEAILYAVGMMIGLADKEVSLSPEQYDVLRKVVGDNRITMQEQEIPVMNIVVSQQTKELVDNAVLSKKE